MQISDQSPYDTPLIASYLRVYSTLGLKNARIRGSGAGWSSLAARRAHNPKVIGSNPIPATKHLKGLIALCVKPFFIFRNGLPCCFENITAHTKSVAADHPKHYAWGGLSATLIVKEHCMTRKTTYHVLQITTDQNQEVLDSSPKFGISFFPITTFGFSWGSTIFSKVLGGVICKRRCVINACSSLDLRS